MFHMQEYGHSISIKIGTQGGLLTKYLSRPLLHGIYYKICTTDIWYVKMWVYWKMIILPR